MGAIPFLLIVLIAIFGFSYIAFNRLRLLGYMQSTNRFKHILDRIKAVFFIGVMQKKMIKGEKKPGTMHAFIFWGFIVILFRKLQLFTIAFDEFFVYPTIAGGLYASLKDIMSLLVLLAVSYALYRRLVMKPARLEQDNKEPLLILSLIFAIMLTDFLYDGFKFALYSNSIQAIAHEESFAILGTHVANLFRSMVDTSLPTADLLNGFLGFGYSFFYWVQITIVFGFLVLLPASEHFHIVVALPAILFKDLERPNTSTSKVPSVDLEALMDEDNESEEEPIIGVNIASDLTWKEGLDAFTCTECGRCKDSCPTWITEKPLAMQWMNMDIRNHMVENEAVMAGEIEGTSLGRLVGDVIKEDTLWACTTCGYCEAACPIELEHLPRIYKMRQNMVMMETEFPEELVNVFNNYENQSNPWGVPADTRGDWAKELDIPFITSDEEMAKYDYLYYVGSPQSFDSRNQKVAHAMVQILKQAGISFGILGKDEKSTGECIRRMGNEMLFQEMAGELIETLNERNVTKIITCDPHVYNTLKNEYKEFGGYFDVIHHTELINELIEFGTIKVDQKFKNVIYHDPCYLGRHNGVFDQPRNIINSITSDTPLEFDMNREKSMCCGAGGGRMWMEETIGSRINETRLEQALTKEPEVIATGCPYCLIMMEEATGNKGVKEQVAPRDIAELVAESLIV
jgi:Fe-S oxidoreductase